VLGALLAAGLAGTAGAAAHRSAAPVTLRIWYGSDDPTEQAWSQKLAAQFAAQHPGTTVQFSFYSLDDMNDKTQLALNGPNPPDLIYSPPRGPGLPAYVRAGRLLDLSAEAQRRGWASQLRPGLLSGYNAVLDGNGTGRDAGHIYAVPYMLAADAVLYNKDIFLTLHLGVPRTVAQFLALLPRLKGAGYTPIGFGNQDGWTGDAWYITLLNAQLGPTALQPALRLSPSFSFAAPPFLQAAATLQGWAKADYFSNRFGGLDPQDAVEAFFDQGTTAMQLISSTEASQVLASWSDDDSKAKDIGVFAFPSVRAGRPPVVVQDGYSGWAIPRASRHSATALDFIDFATSASTAKTLLAHGLIPAHRVDAGTAEAVAPFQRDYLTALAIASPGVFVDAAPIPNFLATMEAQIQLLLQGKETPAALAQSLQQAYASHGTKTQYTDTDGEF
jgi:raffinose/stachyose/melibiose transport system substrate-binding protein